MQADFVDMWHSDTSSFHLPIGEMTITLDDFSYLIYLPIRGKLLDHGRIGRQEGVDLMVTLLGADPGKMLEEETHNRGAHARFTFLETLYNDHVKGATDAVSDDDVLGWHVHICGQK